MLSVRTGTNDGNGGRPAWLQGLTNHNISLSLYQSFKELSCCAHAGAAGFRRAGASLPQMAGQLPGASLQEAPPLVCGCKGTATFPFHQTFPQVFLLSGQKKAEKGGFGAEKGGKGGEKGRDGAGEGREAGRGNGAGWRGEEGRDGRGGRRGA